MWKLRTIFAFEYNFLSVNYLYSVYMCVYMSVYFKGYSLRDCACDFSPHRG